MAKITLPIADRGPFGADQKANSAIIDPGKLATGGSYQRPPSQSRTLAHLPSTDGHRRLTFGWRPHLIRGAETECQEIGRCPMFAQFGRATSIDSSLSINETLILASTSQ